MSAAIALDDVTLGYDGHPAVHHLSGAFAAGSLTAIVGPNGSGKSTLLKAIMGSLTPISGKIVHAGDWRQDVAYLPQSAEIDSSFPADVADLVSLGLWKRRGLWGGLKREDLNAVGAALDAVGLAGFERRGIDTLSGGQMQRALFARVLLQDAKVIVLDEPFSAIDERTTRDLVALISSWHGQGRTIIAVLHDAALVRRVFPQTLLLAREMIGWGATASVMSPQNLARARAMNQAWDDDAPWHDCADESQTVGHEHGAGQ